MTSLRSRIAVAGAAAALALTLTPVAASAHGGGSHRGDDLVRSSFTPSLPTDAAIFGVRPGGAPWVLKRGEVRVRESGRVDVRLKGFRVLRADGTTDNPVASITVGLFCGGTLAVRSEPQALSVPAGNARFRIWLDVPESCDDATVLISPAANAGAYIASAMGKHHED